MPLVRSMFYIYLYFCAFYRLADKLFISPKGLFYVPRYFFLFCFTCFVRLCSDDLVSRPCFVACLRFTSILYFSM